jgi:hypothetical protein
VIRDVGGWHNFAGRGAQTMINRGSCAAETWHAGRQRQEDGAPATETFTATANGEHMTTVAVHSHSRRRWACIRIVMQEAGRPRVGCAAQCLAPTALILTRDIISPRSRGRLIEEQRDTVSETTLSQPAGKREAGHLALLPRHPLTVRSSPNRALEAQSVSEADAGLHHSDREGFARPSSPAM